MLDQKRIVFIQLFFITFVACNRTRYKRELDHCTPAFCNHRGECNVDIRGKANCKCYPQYATGPNCNDIVNNCEGRRFMVECHPQQTKDCSTYYGSRYCHCRPGYGGETCNIYKKGNFKFPVRSVDLMSS